MVINDKAVLAFGVLSVLALLFTTTKEPMPPVFPLPSSRWPPLGVTLPSQSYPAVI